MPKPPTFAFGANWNRFLRHVTEDRVRSAERSLTEFIGTGEPLQPKAFWMSAAGADCSLTPPSGSEPCALSVSTLIHFPSNAAPTFIGQRALP